jgi:hypothetical protein
VTRSTDYDVDDRGPTFLDHDRLPEDEAQGEPKKSRRPASELLQTPGALLDRRHLYELGHTRRSADAVFRALGTVHVPGYKYPFVKADDYLALIEDWTFDGRTRVRP